MSRARCGTVAVLKGGRSLERQVSLRSGARVEDALERLGHEVVGDRRRPRPRRAAARGGARRRVRRAARARRRGRHRPGAARGARDPLHRLGRVGLHALLGQGRSPSTRCATPGIPTPDFFAFTETAFKELGAAEALGAIEERLRFPIVVKPADQGCALGIKFARDAPPTCPAALVAAFSYADKVLLERHVHGRDLAVSILGDEALPIVEAVPREEDFYDFEARYTIGRTTLRLPGRAAATS